MNIVNLKFVNIHDECYTIYHKKNYISYYTLYEYYIICKGYPNAQFNSKYKISISNKCSLSKYFEYCKKN